MPTLFMPMFSEQARNAWLAQKNGFGELINKNSLTKEIIIDAIHEIIDNPSYKMNALRIRK